MKAHVVVCRPYDEKDRDYAIVCGAVAVNGDCGHRVWAAPSTVRMLVADLKLICYECSDQIPQRPDRLSTLPGADRELATLVGTSTADQILAAVRDWRPADG